MSVSTGHDLYRKLRKVTVEVLPDILPFISTEILQEYCAIVEAKRNSSAHERTIYGQVWKECVSRQRNGPEGGAENGCPNDNATFSGRENTQHSEKKGIVSRKTVKSTSGSKLQDPLYIALIKAIARSRIYDTQTGCLTQSIPSYLKCAVEGRTPEDHILASCGHLDKEHAEKERKRLFNYAHAIRKRISGGKKSYTAHGETKKVTTDGITFKAIYMETFPDNADPCNILKPTSESSLEVNQDVSTSSDPRTGHPSCSEHHFPCGSIVHLLTPMDRSDEEQHVVYKVAEGISNCVGGPTCTCHESVQVKVTSIDENPWRPGNRRVLSVPVKGVYIDRTQLCVHNLERCPVLLVEMRSRSAKQISDEATVDIGAYMEQRSKSRAHHPRREEADWLKCLEKYAGAWLEKYPGREVPRPPQGHEDEEVDSLANWISRLVTTVNGRAEGKDDAKQRYAYILLTTKVKDILNRGEKEWWITMARSRGRPRKSADLLTLCKKRKQRRTASTTEDVATPPLTTTSSRGRVRKPKWDETFQYI